MTSTDLAVRTTATTGLPEKIEYATQLAQSDLLPRQYRDKPANILLVMEFGSYLGLPPVAALRLIHIIDNKPVASAELISGRVREKGHRLRVRYDQASKTAVCSIWRADDPGFEFRAVWTWERANAVRDKDGQPLTAKANWRNFYPAMLKWRAVTECARDACAEILLGVSYSPDELGSHVIFDDEADSIPVMTLHQTVEHDQLRRMGEPPAGAVEKLSEPDPDDPWVQAEDPTAAPGVTGTASTGVPAPVAPGAASVSQTATGRPATSNPSAASPQAGKVALDRLAAVWQRIGITDDAEQADIIRWIEPQWTASRKQVTDLTGWLAGWMEAAKGDPEEARSQLWTRYHEANPQEGGDGA